MKKIFNSKARYFLLVLLLFNACSEKELPPDKLIGEWEVFSITDETGNLIVWNELKDDLISLIPEYSCLEFSAIATQQIVSTRYVFVDVNSRGCLSPSIAVYTWKINSETGLYEFTQGTNIVNYLITFSNNDNRMTWNDQTSGTITVWDRIPTDEIISE